MANFDYSNSQEEFIKEKAKQVTLSEKYFEEYSNSIQIGYSRFDISMVFMRHSVLGQVFLGEVTLSPEHAKVLSILLKNNVEEFENQYGEITINDVFENNKNDGE